MNKTGNIVNIGLCLFTSVLLASCGGGGSSSSNVGLNSGNESSLNIRAVSPLDGATLKADFPISIVFTPPNESRAPLKNAVAAAAFRKVTVQGATLKAWRVTSKSSNTEMLFS